MPKTVENQENTQATEGQVVVTTPKVTEKLEAAGPNDTIHEDVVATLRADMRSRTWLWRSFASANRTLDRRRHRARVRMLWSHLRDERSWGWVVSGEC